MTTKTRTFTLAHSPDPDDAFMFYALAKDRIDTGGFRFEHVLSDIQTLNEKAMESAYDITAISFHAYAYLHERYALLRCGSSFGDGYGPVIVSREPLRGPLDVAALKGKTIAIPGKMTSAYLLLRLFTGEVETVVVPFDEIPAAVTGGRAGAGLLIHEGQLTYAEEGLHKIADLGEWWKRETGLPVPLGGNAIRRDLEPELIRRLGGILKQSIEYALDHREAALEYALEFGRGLDPKLGDEFVGMYVNRWTLDCGDDGLRSVQLLLDRAHEKELIPAPVAVKLAF